MKIIAIMLTILTVLLVPFVSNKPFFIIKGEKYYKYKSLDITDTVITAGFLTINKQSSTIYNHFKCK